jgi:hypothetical protein
LAGTELFHTVPGYAGHACVQAVSLISIIIKLPVHKSYRIQITEQVITSAAGGKKYQTLFLLTPKSSILHLRVYSAQALDLLGGKFLPSGFQ